MEFWIRGGIDNLKIVHPHITFVRPFTIPKGCDEEIKNIIIDYCKDRKPISFLLKGMAMFEGDICYIPVISSKLQNFDRNLEKNLEKLVVFDRKLAKKKILHLAANIDKDFPETKFIMDRLTCIRDKKIWFCWDFDTQKIISRDEILAQKRKD